MSKTCPKCKTVCNDISIKCPECGADLSKDNGLKPVSDTKIETQGTKTEPIKTSATKEEENTIKIEVSENTNNGTPDKYPINDEKEKILSIQIDDVSDKVPIKPSRRNPENIENDGKRLTVRKKAVETENRLGKETKNTEKKIKKEIPEDLKKKALELTVDVLSASADASVYHKKENPLPRYMYLIFPALTYLFFFAHIAADKIQLGYVKGYAAALYPLAGIALGILTVAINAGIFSILNNKEKSRKKEFQNCIRGLCMSYGISVLLSLFGLLLKFITGWSAIVFGLGAILFSLVPLTVFSVKIFKDKPVIAYTVPVICGIIQLLICNLFFMLKF